VVAVDHREEHRRDEHNECCGDTRSPKDAAERGHEVRPEEELLRDGHHHRDQRDRERPARPAHERLDRGHLRRRDQAHGEATREPEDDAEQRGGVERPARARRRERARARALRPRLLEAARAVSGTAEIGAVRQDRASGVLGRRGLLGHRGRFGLRALLGVLSYVYLRKRKGVLHYVGFSIMGTILYDAITGIGVGMFLFGQTFWATVIGQIPFTAYHLAGNVVLAATISPLLERWIVDNKLLGLDVLAAKVRHLLATRQ